MSPRLTHVSPTDIRLQRTLTAASLRLLPELQIKEIIQAQIHWSLSSKQVHDIYGTLFVYVLYTYI